MLLIIISKFKMCFYNKIGMIFNSALFLRSQNFINTLLRVCVCCLAS